jgi:hypothetical protein
MKIDKRKMIIRRNDDGHILVGPGGENPNTRPQVKSSNPFSIVKTALNNLKSARMEKSRQNIETLKISLNQAKAERSLYDEEARLKAKLAKERGPSRASQIIGKVQEKLKSAKKSGLFTDTEGDNNPFRQSSGPSSGFMSGLTSGGSNPFYPSPQKTKKRRRQ